MSAKPFILLIAVGLVGACSSQSRPPQPLESTQPAHAPAGNRVGGPFENPELLYAGMPDQVASIDTSPGWDQDGQRIRISGIIYAPDGKTPAPDILLYYYHTDVTGHYAQRNDLPHGSTRHGYIRGWVKSDQAGRYTICTVRPAPYPGGSDPAHIHLTIKEPDINEYYIDDILFDDDPILTAEKRSALELRGGNGVVTLRPDGMVMAGTRDIVLGRNVPGYPGR
jgi:protocatechuate 3,4-dioxygenase beta subunit